jgi:hypothetical protein
MRNKDKVFFFCVRFALLLRPLTVKGGMVAYESVDRPILVGYNYYLEI